MVAAELRPAMTVRATEASPPQHWHLAGSGRATSKPAAHTREKASGTLSRRHHSHQPRTSQQVKVVNVLCILSQFKENDDDKPPSQLQKSPGPDDSTKELDTNYSQALPKTEERGMLPNSRQPVLPCFQRKIKTVQGGKLQANIPWEQKCKHLG